MKAQLRPVSEVIDSLEPIWTEADQFETEAGYAPLVPSRALAIFRLTTDRDTAYTLLRDAITKKRLIEAAFPGSTITLDWKQGHNQALDDILTLLDHIYGKTDALTK